MIKSEANKILLKFKDITDKYSSNLVLKAFIMNLLFLCFYLLFFLWKFETNDDDAMNRIVSGAYGDYTAYIVFINIVIGKFLKTLYILFPAVPWYVLMHIVTSFVSLFVITYLLNKCKGAWGNVISILILSYMGYELYVIPQFTKTAGIAAIAGTTLLAYALEQKKRKKILYVAGWCLSLLGAMIRFEMYLVVLALSVLLGVHGLFVRFKNNSLTSKEKFKNIRNYVLSWSVVIVSAFLLYAVNSYTYNSNDEWRDFSEYNAARAQLLDLGFPEYEENREDYERLGVSESDLLLYLTWNFADPDNFNTDLMNELIALKKSPSIDLIYILKYIRAIIVGSFSERGFCFLMLMFPIMYILKIKPKNFLYYIVATLLLNFYFYYSGRYLIHRVDVIVWCTVLIMITLSSDTTTMSTITINKRIIALICIILCVDMYSANISFRKVRPNNFQELSEMLASDEDNLYLSDLTTFPYTFPFFKNIPKGFQKNFYSLGGWQTMSPTQNAILKNYNIRNPFRDVIDRSDVYLIDEIGIEQKVAYINRHYSPSANAALVKNVHDTHIYQIVTSSPQINMENLKKNRNIKSNITCSTNNKFITVQGYAYIDGTDSWSQRFYTVFTHTEDKKNYFFYSTQKMLDKSDNFHGKYGAYETTFNPEIIPQGNYTVTQIMEIDGVFYSVGSTSFTKTE